MIIDFVRNFHMLNAFFPSFFSSDQDRFPHQKMKENPEFPWSFRASVFAKLILFLHIAIYERLLINDYDLHFSSKEELGEKGKV